MFEMVIDLGVVGLSKLRALSGVDIRYNGVPFVENDYDLSDLGRSL
jgi:hypothetical protein